MTKRLLSTAIDDSAFDLQRKATCHRTAAVNATVRQVDSCCASLIFPIQREEKRSGGESLLPTRLKEILFNIA